MAILSENLLIMMINLYEQGKKSSTLILECGLLSIIFRWYHLQIGIEQLEWNLVAIKIQEEILIRII